MNKEEVHELIKQWSHETCMLSYHDTKHTAYRKLVATGKEVIPFLLERLRDSIGHDSGDSFDNDNSPWISVIAIGEISNHEATKDFPRKYAGNLKKLREHILKWGEAFEH